MDDNQENIEFKTADVINDLTDSISKKEFEKFRDSKKEQAQRDEHWHEAHPNSVLIPFGRSFISWHSDSGVAVLALIILIVLCVLSVIVSFFAMWCHDKIWAVDFLKILGQGIVATAGAVVGAGATSSIKKKKNNDK